MVAGDVEALDGQLARDPAEKIRGEDERAFQQDDDDDRTGGEIALDLLRHAVEAALDDFLVNKDALDVVFHGGRMGDRRGIRQGGKAGGGQHHPPCPKSDLPHCLIRVLLRISVVLIFIRTGFLPILPNGGTLE